MKQLKFQNEEIPGFFISEEGKIYDSDGVEQKQKFYQRYYHFKGKHVHVLMAHSFFEYKPGFEIHHKNFDKLDNRLENLMYLSKAEHLRLHKIGNKNMLGKKLSPETKQKIGSAQKGKKHRLGKKHSPETIQKMCKKVYCSELEKTFDSIKRAANELKLFPDSITKVCKGKLKTTGGFHFSYFNKSEQI